MKHHAHIAVALAAFVSTAQGQSSFFPDWRTDWDLVIADFQFSQHWSITSDADVNCVGGYARAVAASSRTIGCDKNDSANSSGPDSDAKICLDPGQCDSVHANSSAVVAGLDHCLLPPPPTRCEADATTELCLLANGWQLTGDSLSEGHFVLGPFKVWAVSPQQCIVDDCVYVLCGPATRFDRLPAIGAASGSIDFKNDTTVFVTGVFSAQSAVSFYKDIECGVLSPPNPTPSLVGAVHIRFGANATRSDASTESVYSEGILAWYDDRTDVRLGFFSDSAFTPTYDQDGDASIDVSDFSIGLPLQSSDIVALDVYTDSDMIAAFDGDLDQSGTTCWSDRETMVGVIGSTLGDGVYVLRADFDLDGDVDASDAAAFNAVGCTGDVNCDGAVNTADWTAFLNLWNANDASADINMNGSVNTADVSAYLNVYNIGCP